MPNDTGTPSAPDKADAKSGNVSGEQAVQMLVKRQAEAPAPKPAAEHVEPPPEETADKSAPPEKTETPSEPVEPEPKKTEAEKPKPEEAPDDALSQLTPEQRERFQKRIDKEVARRGELEREIARLKQIAIAGQPAPQPPPAPALVEFPTDSPLSSINDPVELQKQVDAALEAKDWAQAQLDAEVPEVTLNGQKYDKVALRNIIRNSERLISRDIPKRAAFLQQKSQVEQRVMETFGAEPWMQDPTSEGYQAFLALKKDPDIAKRPNGSWVAAVQVQGLLDVQRKLKASGSKETPPSLPKPKAPASQTATGAGFAPSRDVGSEGKAVKELQKELEKLKGKKGVSGKDVEAYLRMVEKTR